jgi:bacterioferritin (cytochrome b1)
MHGDQKVIEQLNAALASELTAIVQYMVQSETLPKLGIRAARRLPEETRNRGNGSR